MGYRSEVKCLINLKERDVEDVKKEIIDLVGEDFFDEIKTNKTKKLVLCSADYIKWYDSYPEVRNFEIWMRKQSEKFSPTNKGTIHFVRIGDDLDDIEEKCYGEMEYFLDVRRHIDDGDFTEE